MIERFVVAYDGSEQAGSAFEVALRMARATGRPLHGRRVIEPSAPVIGPSDPIGVLDPAPAPAVVVSAEEMREEHERAEREGAAALARLGAACAKEGVAYSSSMHDGPLVETLVDVASATDVLVVGKKGRFARGGVGSGTRALIRQAPCAVLVVSGAWEPSRTVVVAFDGTTESKRALSAAREIARGAGWGLTVIASSKEKNAEETRAWASGFAPEAERVEVVENGKRVETAAMERAGGAGALVAMGAYHESFVHDLLLGSPAGGAVERASVPVLLAH